MLYTSLFAYIAYVAYFLVVDVAWIQSFVLPTYNEALQSPLRSLGSTQDLLIALFVYLLLLVGNMVLAGSRISVDNYPMESILYGGLFGLVVYGVYSGTNYVIFPQWTTFLVLSDSLWGMFLCASSLLVFFGVTDFLSGSN